MPADRTPAVFPPFAVTVDLVILSVRDGALSVLLVARGVPPFRGKWALPGGFVHVDEDLDHAAYRELKEEAGIGRSDVVLEQLRTYGTPKRDPRQRVVTVAWLALGADLPEPFAGSDAAAAQWIPVSAALGGMSLAFDHVRILEDGVERAKAKLEYTGYAAALCGPTFTIGELHAVYEAVWGVTLDRANFQRKVIKLTGFLTETGESTASGRGRPARLFRGDPHVSFDQPFLRGAD